MDTPKRYHPLLVTLHWLMAVLVIFNLYFGLFVVMDLRNFAQLNTNLAIHMAVGVTILVLLLIRFIVRLRTRKPETVWTGNAFMDRFSRLVHYGLYFFLLVMTVAGLIYSLQTFFFQSILLGQPRPAFAGPGGFNRGGFGTPGTPPIPGTPGTPAPRLNAQGTPFAPGLQVSGGEGGDDGNGQQGEGRRPGGGFGPGGPGGGRFGGGGGALGFLRGFSGPLVLAIHAFTAVILILLLVFHIGAALYHQFIRKDNLIGRMWYGKS